MDGLLVPRFHSAVSTRAEWKRDGRAGVGSSLPVARLGPGNGQGRMMGELILPRRVTSATLRGPTIGGFSFYQDVVLLGQNT